MSNSYQIDESLLEQHLVRAFEEGRFGDAMRLLEPQAHARQDPEFFNNLGALFYQLEMLIPAEWAFRRTLDLDPHHGEAIQNLANFYEFQGLPYSSMQVLRRAAECGVPEAFWKDRLTKASAEHKFEKVSIFLHGLLRGEPLERCLEGIRRQTYPPHELLLVSDSIPEDCRKLVESRGIRVIPMPPPKTHGALYNTALSFATGDFLALVSTEVELESPWLERVMLNFTDATIAGVGGRLLEGYTSTVADRWRRLVIEQHWGHGRLTNPRALFSADCVYRIAELRSMGGWSSSLSLHLEHFDLAKRLTETGFNLVYEPKANCRHLHRDDVDSVLRSCWTWNSGAKARDGMYKDVGQAARCLPANRGSALKVIDSLISRNRVELLYPAFLLYFRWSLLDLERVRDHHPETTDVVSQTALAIFLLVKNQLAAQYSMTGVVNERTLTDLRQALEELLEPSERALLNSKERIDEAVPPTLTNASTAVHTIGAVLTRADPDYLKAFAEDLLLNFLGPGVGAAVETSIRTLQQEEEDALPENEGKPRYLLLNPPARVNDQSAGLKDGVGRCRWLEPSRIERVAQELRSAGARVTLVDAVAEHLTEREGLERVWGMSPDKVVYSLAEGGLERLIYFARLVKLSAPHIKQILVFAGNISEDSEKRKYPMFDEVYNEIDGERPPSQEKD